MLTRFIIHQTHYEKSDWSRASNQFTTACELDMINAISATDIERFASVSENELCEKCIIKQLLNSLFA